MKNILIIIIFTISALSKGQSAIVGVSNWLPLPDSINNGDSIIFELGVQFNQQMSTPYPIGDSLSIGIFSTTSSYTYELLAVSANDLLNMPISTQGYYTFKIKIPNIPYIGQAKFVGDGMTRVIIPVNMRNSTVTPPIDTSTVPPTNTAIVNPIFDPKEGNVNYYSETGLFVGQSNTGQKPPFSSGLYIFQINYTDGSGASGKCIIE
jgi:hypothetical protein